MAMSGLGPIKGWQEDAMFRRSVAVTFAAVACSALSGLLLVAATPTAALAADLKLLGPVSLRVVLPSVLPQFEQSSGHKVTVGYATLGAITKRLLDGEAADVVMVSPASRRHRTTNCASGGSCWRVAAWRSPRSASPSS
jgi:ABC-type molybdate transport system substrate-binding protein